MAHRPGVNNGAHLVDLDDLLPDDMAFLIGGQQFAVPGDLPVPTMLQLMRAFEQLQALQGEAADAGSSERAAEAMANLHQRVLGVFALRSPAVQAQIEEVEAAEAEGRDPDPEKLVVVLGMAGLVRVTTSVMEAMGAVAEAPEQAEGGARPTPRGTTARSKPRTVAATKRSR